MDSNSWNRVGLYLDDQDKLHILDPEKTKSSIELTEQCADFIESITEFKGLVDEFVELIEIVSKEVDKSKIDAFTTKNELKSFEIDFEKKKSILTEQIEQKKSELNRLKQEIQLLSEEQQYQLELIAQFNLQEQK